MEEATPSRQFRRAGKSKGGKSSRNIGKDKTV